jgi:hypothetical protein
MKEYLQGSLGLKFDEPSLKNTLTIKNTPTIRVCNQCRGEHKRSSCPRDDELAEKWIDRTCSNRNRRKYTDVVCDLKEDVDYWQKKRIYEKMTVDVDGSPDSSNLNYKQLTCHILNQLHKNKRFKEITVECKDVVNQYDDEEDTYALVSHSISKYMDHFRQTKDECLKDLVKVETESHEVFLGLRANQDQVLEQNAMPAATREWLMRNHNQVRFELDMKRKLTPRAEDMAQALLKHDLFPIKETSGKGCRMDIKWKTATPAAECCICLETIKRQDMVLLDSCTHDACNTCVAEMMAREANRQITCPQCRTPSAHLSCYYPL